MTTSVFNLDVKILPFLAVHNASPQGIPPTGIAFYRTRIIIQKDLKLTQNTALPGMLSKGKEDAMQNVLGYLKWENTKKGVRITGCDQSFEGAMAIPDHINGIPVVEIGEEAFEPCATITTVAMPATVEVVGE